MDRNTPPSPALARFEGLPSGFNELLQHNAAVSASYPRDGPSIHAEPSRVRSQPTSRYGTPIPQAHRPHTFDTSIMQYQSGYRTNMYPHDSSPYGPIPEASQPYNTPATSPPTPSRASDVITTRSGNVIHRSSGLNALGPKSARVEKATTKKKRKTDKGKIPKNVPVLDKPMSQITLEVDVPVANIDEYVNRSCEIRRQEVEIGKNPGRIKRPMNAFMLYRKAYQLRAKEWASQHNHQVVSRVCGLSWPMEPEQVREQFKAWAETERDNHQKAHPDYKFTPSKPAVKPQKSPTQSRFDQSDGSDLDNIDWASSGIPGGLSRAGSYNHMRSTTKTPADELDGYYGGGGGGMYGPPHGYHTHTHAHAQLADIRSMGMGNRATYEFANPGKVMSSQYDPRDISAAGQYYETTRLQHNPRQLPHGMVEDVMISSSGSNKPGLHSPSQVFHQTHHLYPSQYHDQQASHHSLPQPQAQPHRGGYEHRIDPSLMFDAAGSGGMGSMLLESGLPPPHQQQQPQSTWQTGNAGEVEGGAYSSAFLGLDETLSMDHASMEQQAQLLRVNPGEWHREELPETEQFDMSWMDASPTKGGEN